MRHPRREHDAEECRSRQWHIREQIYRRRLCRHDRKLHCLELRVAIWLLLLCGRCQRCDDHQFAHSRQCEHEFVQQLCGRRLWLQGLQFDDSEQYNNVKQRWWRVSQLSQELHCLWQYGQRQLPAVQ